VKRRIERGFPVTQSCHEFLGRERPQGEFAPVHKNGKPLIETLDRGDFQTFHRAINEPACAPADFGSLREERPYFQSLPHGKSFVAQYRGKTPLPDFTENGRIERESEFGELA